MKDLFAPLLLLLASGWMTPATAADGGVPAATLKAMDRGMNLSLWFTHRDQLDSYWQARQYPDAADWALLKSQQLLSVRVQFDPAWFRDPAAPQQLLPARIAILQAALKPAWDQGFLVVLAADPVEAEKIRLVANASGQAELAAFWKLFAKAFSSSSPRRLVFEALNEPLTADAASNQLLMAQLVSAIRSSAPRHTVVVEGHQYGSVDQLIAMQPLAFDNLVYSFHFYEPYNFTHQGATWSWPMFAKLKGLPYPSSPDAVADAARHAEEDAKPHVVAYGEARWDSAKLAARIQPVVDWAKRAQRPVWCGEFGVSRLGPPLEARRQWLLDVRSALQAGHIGWAAFDYAGDFGLVTGQGGARVLLPEDAAANVLPLPERPQ